MKELINSYHKAQPISTWSEFNQPDEDLIYRSGVGTQEQKMLGISYVCGFDPPHVISYHTSKSVRLAVPAYYKEIRGYKAWIFSCMRDNFHDLNCTIVCSHDIEMNMHDIYRSVTREWLEKQKQGALDYMCPKPERNLEAHRGYDIIVAVGDDDWDWYDEYWSGSKIIKQDGNYFLAHRAYLEGMPRQQVNYEGFPTNEFTFTSNSYAHVAYVIQKAMRATKTAAFRKQYPKVKIDD